MKKLFVFLSGISLGIVVLILVVVWWLGAFNRVELLSEERGPYRIICMDHVGPYHEIANTILEVQDRLKDVEDRLGGPCAIYYDDPAKVPKEKLRSKGGFLLKDEVEAKGLLEIVTMPRRMVLLGRLKGHPSLAPIKVYPAMAEWMEKNGFVPAGPAVEFYHKRFVECEIAIRPAGQ